MLMRELVKRASGRDLTAPSRNLTAASLRKSDERDGGTREVVLPNRQNRGLEGTLSEERQCRKKRQCDWWCAACDG